MRPRPRRDTWAIVSAIGPVLTRVSNGILAASDFAMASLSDLPAACESLDGSEPFFRLKYNAHSRRGTWGGRGGPARGELDLSDNRRLAGCHSGQAARL